MMDKSAFSKTAGGVNSTELQRYADVNSLLLDTYGEKCQDFKYDSMIGDLKKTDWKSSAAEGGTSFSCSFLTL
jgi:hypothetical protein